MPSAQIDGAGAAGEVDERADESNLGWIGVHVGDERPVELDHVGAHAHDLLEAGVALARVVDGDARAARPQRVEVALERVHVEHALLLGYLDDDAAEVGGQLLVHLGRGERRRAQVDRQEAALRAAGGGEREPHGVGLERRAEPEAVGL